MKATLKKGHVQWVLANLLALKCGELPEGSKRGSIPFVKGGTTLTSALFTDVAEDVGEVERRLNLCGIDGLILKLWFTCGESNKYIALNLGLTEKEVKKGGKKAMKFITGFWPKSESYKSYRNHHKGG